MVVERRKPVAKATMVVEVSKQVMEATMEAVVEKLEQMEHNEKPHNVSS